MGLNYIGVMTFTFLGHVTSSVTWPMTSRDHSNPNGPFPIGGSVDPSLYLQPVFEIFGPKYIEVTTLTFPGHVTSSVTCPFESQWIISYWWSIGPKSLSLTDSEILCPKHHVPIGTMLNRHWLDISHIYCVPYLPRELYNRPDPFPSLMA